MPKLKHPLLSIALLLSFAMLILVVIANINLKSLDKAATELTSTNRSASLLSLRLQALTIDFELTLNEYYSTVIDQRLYLDKSASLRRSIDADLVRLNTLPEREYTLASEELKQLMNEIEKYRSLLDKAMGVSDRDWDAAREALFKINILSIQAIKVASETAKFSEKRGENLSSTVFAEQQDIQLLLYAAIILALMQSLIAGGLLLRKA